jgi:hypothetical protein
LTAGSETLPPLLVGWSVVNRTGEGRFENGNSEGCLAEARTASHKSPAKGDFVEGQSALLALSLLQPWRDQGRLLSLYDVEHE